MELTPEDTPYPTPPVDAAIEAGWVQVSHVELLNARAVFEAVQHRYEFHK